MFIPQTSKDTIRRLLGYPVQGRLGLVLPQLNEDYPQDSIDRISEILIETQDIDAQRKDSRSQSMATEVDDIKVSFPQHLKYLRSERQVLIRELCAIVDLKPFADNQGASSNTVAIQYQ